MTRSELSRLSSEEKDTLILALLERVAALEANLSPPPKISGKSSEPLLRGQNVSRRRLRLEMSTTATSGVVSVPAGLVIDDHLKLATPGDAVFYKNPIIAINFPEEGCIRARTVVSRSRARPTGKYPSWKMGRMVQWESPHELNAIRLLDADPTVTSFQEQPLEIRYVMDGEVRRHFPDLLVRYGSTVELWEIKPDKEGVNSEIERRSRILSAALPLHGYAYRLVFGRNLTLGARLANSLTLLRHGREEVAPMERERLRLLFTRAGAINWGHVVDGALGPTGRRQICRLVLEGIVGFDTEQLLRADTILKWICIKPNSEEE